MPTPEENKELARRWMDEVVNKHNLEYAAEMIADDYVDHSPPFPDLPPDKKGALEGLRRFFESAPDIREEILQLIATGNKVAVRSMFSGTNTGPMPGPDGTPIPPTGKSFSAEAIHVITMNEEGKAVEHYGIFDVPTMMTQIGLLPPPG